MRPLKNKSRRDILKGGAAVGGVSVAPGILAQAAPAPVRIGYTMARTGPWTGGAQVTQEPN
jgi:branched-chain amino acid transport system substrate-binding protein